MKISFRCLVWFCVAFIAVAARAADDLRSLSGTWKPTQAELGGAPMPPPVLKAITLKMDGANYEVVVITEKGASSDKGTIAIDADTKPKSMTVVGVEGPNAGKTFPAIYELDGDTLRICYELAGKDRPKEFKTAPGTMLYLVTYERAK